MQTNAKSQKSDEVLSLSVMTIILILTQIVTYVVTAPYVQSGIASRRHPVARQAVDEYEIYLNPLVWGKGNVHVLRDRGTIRMELYDVKRFDSGVILLTYLSRSLDLV